MELLWSSSTKSIYSRHFLIILCDTRAGYKHAILNEIIDFSFSFFAADVAGGGGGGDGGGGDDSVVVIYVQIFARCFYGYEKTCENTKATN